MYAQNGQTVINNSATTAINFPGEGCIYQWVNSNPAIGLPASGVGNIAPFTAVNTGNSPITATITATSISQGYAYIANYHDNSISIINTETQEVSTLPATGFAPYGVAVDPYGTRAYVANLGDGNVLVIDTRTNRIINTIQVGDGPISLVTSRDGRELYVASENAGNVAVINTSTSLVDKYIPLPGVPYGLAISPDGKIIYTSLLGSGLAVSNLLAVNTATGDVIATIPVGTYPGGVAISPDGKRVYVACMQNLDDGTSDVTVINTGNNDIVAKINVGKSAIGVAVNPDGSKVYVTCLGGNRGQGGITVIDAQSNTIVSTITLGAISAGISFSPDGSKLYTGDTKANTVLVINTANNSTLATVPVGQDPSSFGSFVTAGYGCSIFPVKYTITVNPTNKPAVVIPNSFSPNGDGTNDTWVIKNIDNYANCTVAIYNRYGAKVYSSTGYQVVWNGLYHGVAIPSGTYYYIIDLKEGSKALSGSLTVLR
ncbi:hypothetical protein GCM10022210_05110 [Mucilaginibacter dorajii]|uniref:Uncharacterized protein n=2 Tax=Mucilaginibacter dorajii TaxID=692994 RepID=A0ABP7P652_9SPHI